MKIITILIIYCLLPGSYLDEQLFLLETWEHGERITGRASFTMIDCDNCVIGTFYKDGNLIITPKKIIQFAPQGQGPGELMDIMALFPYEEGIALVERPDVVKTFRKNEETYVYLKSIYFERDPLPHFIKNGLYLNHKFFLAGMNILSMKKNHIKVSFLKVYDKDGKPIKDVLTEEFDKPNQFYRMDCFILKKEPELLFLKENVFEITIIDPDNLKIIKKIELTKPEFYKAMPDDFYAFKHNYTLDQFMSDIEKWKTSYSIITKAIIESNNLIIQIRTCDEKLKKFALLFYDLKSYKLCRTLFIDDLLLGSKDGIYYFHSNGDPGLDPEAIKTTIKLYSFRKN